MGVIYLRTNKINGKKYVGQTVDIEQRQKTWKSINHYAGKAIYNARKKYGIDAFDFEILMKCKDEELDYWEMYYIKELNTKIPYGYNMTDGGETSWIKGKHHSEETKNKISESRMGEKHWFCNKELSEEHRKKIGETLKGRTLSEETKEKIRQAHLGKKPSEESKKKMSEAQKHRKPISEKTKKKMSEAQKGKTPWNKGKYNTKKIKQILQINTVTNEIITEFPSMSEIERQLGYNHSNILNCCNGKRKTAYGYKWQFKTTT